MLVGAVALFVSSNAQMFGVKGGANISGISNVDNVKSKFGFYAGAFMNAPIAESFSIQPEVLYSTKGGKTTGDVEIVGSADYISVPVMFQYHVTPQIYLEAGPEFSFLLSANAKTGGVSSDIKNVLTGFDLGIGLGAGYYFTENIGLTARYVAGVTDMVKDNPNDAVRNSVFQVGLAYKFGY